MGTLIIEKVDLELLEKQRLDLIKLSSRPDIKSDSLDGVLSMLDAWSDKRAEEVKQ